MENGRSKRRFQEDPKGLDNERSFHLRKSIFGEEKGHLFSAGIDTMPKLNKEAASGHFYHSVTNMPLDVKGYNDGFDSSVEDEGAEAKWRLRMGDINLGDVSDMSAVEVYFFNLWNQFINIDCKSNDNDININEPASDRMGAVCVEVWR